MSSYGYMGPVISADASQVASNPQTALMQSTMQMPGMMTPIGPPPNGGSVLPHSEFNSGAPILPSGPMQMGPSGARNVSQMPHLSINPATNDAPLEFNTTKNKPPIAMLADDSHDDPIIIDERRERSSHRDRSRDRSRDRDHDRERHRNRDRDREKGRNRDRFQKDSDVVSRSGRRSGSAQTSSNDSAPTSNSNLTPAPDSSQCSQNYNQIGPWGPMWNPITPMAPMGAPVGAMGPIAPLGPIGPMPPPAEAPPLSGDFRIRWGMFGWVMSQEGTTVPVKNPLHVKTCVLVPPNRLAPPPSTRDRPVGCRTVFVGGLPENVTEETVRDVFERCGEVTTVRLSKKNFCHIRYDMEEFVDNAIFLSGYRMRINNSTDAANTGRLHVDYAQARDDQYEWECHQRQLQREQRHRERMEAERLRPPSPPPVVHFSDHEAGVISDQLKVDDTFAKAAQIVITWLERGDCNKRNAGIFYSMIQSTNSHVRRLLSEKSQYEEELAKFREQTRARMQGVVMQFGQIERVFSASSRQKVWDHFTKAQRRNIEMWRKQAEEIKQIQLDESDKDDTEEMDLSEIDEDRSSPPRKKKKACNCSSNSSHSVLKEENDSLRCQMEAYKNEVELVKDDLKVEVSQRDEQIVVLKKTLQGMQSTLAEAASQRKQFEAKVMELQSKLKLCGEEIQNEVCESTSVCLPEKTAWLIGLISTFLHIHPKGASVDYIWSYVQQFDKDIRPPDIEALLNQFVSVYKQITTGVGACLERKWIFTGFNQEKD